MADIILTVATDTSDGAESILFLIDGTVAKPLDQKTRTVRVRSAGTYDYDYIIRGTPGGKASYEVKQGEDVILAKSERKIRAGSRRYNGGGRLTVK